MDNEHFKLTTRRYITWGLGGLVTTDDSSGVINAYIKSPWD